ncbi:SAF domain-containing protein [Actinomadura sp. 9N407]|uniref:SAF domain-containing protein n=1 Tax=Actinomadura sp. 9N407 TaxID=3375154 RepID=UPI0037BABAE3
MLMALAVLTNVYLFQSSGERVSVVRVARDVPVGQPISRADVDVARVAVDGSVQTVPGRQLGEVVGRRAAVGLRTGTLLTASQVTAEVSPAAGQALVTVPLKVGEVPPGLAPGWQVRVVSTPGAQGQSAGQAGASAAGAAPQDVAGVVDQVGEPTTEGTVTVSLLVAEGDSVAVARQAAAGLVALVVTARRG